MSEQWNQWLLAQASLRGLLACALGRLDQAPSTLACGPAFPAEALDRAWRCVAETLEALGPHRAPAVHLRWVFEHALLFCAARPDGLVLMALATRRAEELDGPGMQKLFTRFLEAADLQP